MTQRYWLKPISSLVTGPVSAFVLLCAVFAPLPPALAQSGERMLVVAPKQQCPGEARHALVIGNSAYINGPLRNPVNDARAMSKALGEVGFDTIYLHHVGKEQLPFIHAFGEHVLPRLREMAR